MLPAKLAAGGQLAPPEDVQAIAEKFRLVGMVNGFEVHVWAREIQMEPQDRINVNHKIFFILQVLLQIFDTVNRQK
jgi:hypothetical protein